MGKILSGETPVPVRDLLFRGPAENDHPHTEQGDARARPVEDGEVLAVHDLQPDEGSRHIDPAVGRIDTPAGGRMECEEPGKDSKAERCGN